MIFASCNFLLIVLLSSIAFADSFQLNETQIAGKSALIAQIQLNNDEPQLSLYWKDEMGRALKTFEALQNWMHSKKKSLLFAANAGIYRDTPTFAPVGLHVEKGSERSRLSFANGCGNFCWYSGVFFIEENRAYLKPREEVRTRDFSGARLALQSGPLLMRSGTLQGTWSSTSYNLNRSAVCTTSRAGEVLMILVMDATNLKQFFSALKEARCQDALFLDGAVSAFYDGRQRKRFGDPDESYAGILAVTQ
jgi:uncharacterized protein YigE (DUF2233 family)